MGASGADSPGRNRHPNQQLSNGESSKEPSMRGTPKYLALLLAVTSAVSTRIGPPAAAFIGVPQPAVTVRP